MKAKQLSFIALAIAFISMTGCMTAAKIDQHLSMQYNNQLPNPKKAVRAEIEVKNGFPSATNSISSTKHKRDKFLPLLVYWKIDHRYASQLNTAIPVTNFTNTINSAIPKGLLDKLNGKKLVLTVEQAPSSFSWVYKENLVFAVLYMFSWYKMYIEPDVRDLVVSYNVIEGNQAVKTGKITIDNPDRNKRIRLWSTWKNNINEYLLQYNTNMNNMTKAFLSQLNKEI